MFHSTGGGDIEVEPSELKYCGRWAGDRIVVIGDYDSSGLYDEVKKKGWKDISVGVAKEFNEFIGDDDLKVIIPTC